MVIYWNSNANILIFWDTDFWLSLAISSNHHQKKKKKTLKCNISKINERFAFWNKLTFSPYSIFFRCTCKYIIKYLTEYFWIQNWCKIKSLCLNKLCSEIEVDIYKKLDFIKEVIPQTATGCHQNSIKFLLMHFSVTKVYISLSTLLLSKKYHQIWNLETQTFPEICILSSL